jgi:hypothetical protein
VRKAVLDSLPNKGSRLAWLIYLDNLSVEVCTLDATGNLMIEVVDQTGTLDGSTLLPELYGPVQAIFSQS